MGVCASLLFFFNDTATTEIYTLSLHDALPISRTPARDRAARQQGEPAREPDPAQEGHRRRDPVRVPRSEEHTSELQSQSNLVCRLLLEKKKTTETLKIEVTGPTVIGVANSISV